MIPKGFPKDILQNMQEPALQIAKDLVVLAAKAGLENKHELFNQISTAVLAYAAQVEVRMRRTDELVTVVPNRYLLHAWAGREGKQYPLTDLTYIDRVVASDYERLHSLVRWLQRFIVDPQVPARLYDIGLELGGRKFELETVEGQFPSWFH